ncbi:T9SS type A sorting domain-containing protein [Flavobacterium sp.]|uniref:T9SS type A sorting domain-containing protein n=1 Tax=Flavobacterium sp. TaxID=239 RepID=UPI00286D22A6|nr:T9SS type A sorting domain-containing protein [Flavobacterium sp.]
MKKITFNVLFAFAMLLSAIGEAQCLSATDGLYPAATYTATTCDGITANTITTAGYAGEYSNVNVVSGETYVFGSSIATDYITVSSDDGVSAATSGLTPLTWVADVTGVVRFYTHADDLCGENHTFRLRTIKCGIAPCTLPTITFAKVSNCPDATFNVTAEITDTGSASAITVTDDQGGSPQSSGVGLLTFGPYNNGTSVILTAVNDDSAVCTISSPAQTQVTCPALNDNFVDAIAISCGNNYTGNTVGASLDEDNAPDGFGADMDAPNLWYSFTGSGFSETVTLNLCNSSYDTSVLIYTGSSGALTLVAGNDDDNTCGVGLTTRSRLNFVSDGTSTYYIAIEGFNVGSTGAFTMDVTCEGVTPPASANQTCATALDVPVDNSDVTSDNSYGDVSPEVPTCDLFGSIQDVWFSFVAPAEGTVDVTVSNGTMTSSNFNVHSGACGALTAYAAACNSNVTTSATESLTGLTAGETYFVQVWSNFAEQGTFSLRLSNPSLGVGGFDKSNFETYPNPVTDVLNISYDKNITSVEVFNLIGQEVFSKTSTSTISQVDLSNLAKGAYMVKITSENLVKAIKIIKQ